MRVSASGLAVCCSLWCCCFLRPWYSGHPLLFPGRCVPLFSPHTSHLVTQARGIPLLRPAVGVVKVKTYPKQVEGGRTNATQLSWVQNTVILLSRAGRRQLFDQMFFSKSSDCPFFVGSKEFCKQIFRGLLRGRMHGAYLGGGRGCMAHTLAPLQLRRHWGRSGCPAP